MSTLPNISFKKTALPKSGSLFLLASDSALSSPMGKELDKLTAGQLSRVVKSAGFEGKAHEVVEVLAPTNTGLDRIVIMGVGDAPDEFDWTNFGGALGARIKAGSTAMIMAETGPSGKQPHADELARMAEGLVLRAYNFDRHKTVTRDKEAKDTAAKVMIGTDQATAARKSFAVRCEVAAGTVLARDLVNEPANLLGPDEFAAKAKELEALGAKVTILSERQMAIRKMNALLAVGFGSERESKLAIVEWKGGKKGEAPICFVGKGVVFDTGGISLKPPAGMENMKGDMGGAAAVLGLMRALVGRKAKVNVVGILGLVENMPDGKAQRPGDIVTSMSGQTIEVINTDAEGRLVLCDALWFAQETYKPRFVINLATLTGAVMVALGSVNAGMFSNNDILAENLKAASKTSGEGLWRMPLGKAYDKMIDSRFADMKNTGGRWAGSITAAQFLHRFIKDDTPWAHLDIAGTAMESPKTDISRGWASGYGVRLLDQLVADFYET